MALIVNKLLSGNIDDNALIDFPTYLKTENNGKYKLTIRDTDLQFVKLKFEFVEDGYILRIPFFEYNGFNYNFVIDWGDYTPVVHVDTSDFNILRKLSTHTYSVSGTYIVKITGEYAGFNNANYSLTKDNMTPNNNVTADYNLINYNAWEYLTEVIQWGTTNYITMSFAFYNAINLKKIPNDLLPDCLDYSFCFANCRMLQLGNKFRLHLNTVNTQYMFMGSRNIWRFTTNTWISFT